VHQKTSLRAQDANLQGDFHPNTSRHEPPTRVPQATRNQSGQCWVGLTAEYYGELLAHARLAQNAYGKPGTLPSLHLARVVAQG